MFAGHGLLQCTGKADVSANPALELCGVPCWSATVWSLLPVPYIYYYTPLPLNLANKQQATGNKQASKHLSFPFWRLLGLIAPGSTLL